MRVYRLVWLAGWGVLAGLGVCLGSAAWTTSAVVATLVLGVAPAGIVCVAYLRREGAPEISNSDLLRVVGRWVVVAGLAVLAVSICATVVGAMIWPLLLLAVASCPWVLAYPVRWLQARSPGITSVPRQPQRPERPARSVPAASSHAAGPSDPNPVPAAAWAPAVQGFSDAELCRAWRASFPALQKVDSPQERAQLVALRQAYLDEIERRNPAGLEAWLRSGARAAGNPGKYVARPAHNDGDQGTGHREAS